MPVPRETIPWTERHGQELLSVGQKQVPSVVWVENWFTLI